MKTMKAKRMPARRARPNHEQPRAPEVATGHQYCAVPPVAERTFGPEVSPDRVRLIALTGKKWVNGTVLHDKRTDGENVVLSDGSTEWRRWTTVVDDERWG